MRNLVFIALMLAGGVAAFANSGALFTGGSGDGCARADYLLPPPPSLAWRFLGGSQDGYASAGWNGYQPVLTPAIARFAGGARDGYASGDWRGYQPSVTPALARFVGGQQDGYAASGWRGYQPPKVPALMRFAGGLRDGYASATFLSSWLQNPPRRFLGGGFDGYDSRAVRGLANWSLGDTDGNGLPDWWELKYFGVLTGTNPGGDPDHDGASNLYEYLTGTNPTNAVSYFHITRVVSAATNRVFVYCAPPYFYTLQRSTNLPSGWMNVTNQIRISPSSEGILEMDDFSSGDWVFYRVVMEQ